MERPNSIDNLTDRDFKSQVKDPVCGMQVDPVSAQHKTQYKGKNFYFCCGGCLTKFQANPEKTLSLPPQPMGSGLVSLAAPATSSKPMVLPTNHSTERLGVPPRANLGEEKRSYICPMCPEVRQLGPGPCPKCGMALDSESPASLTTTTQYTCPMHPEVLKTEPGNCPICGMALEPRTVTVEEDNPELRDMTRRFWVALAFTAPLLGIAMGGMLLPHEFMVSPWDTRLPWVEFALASPVVLWGGWPFFQRGWTSIVHRSTNMFTLIAMGTGVAYVFSVVATLFPQIFAPSFRTTGDHPDIYFEAAAAIVTLVLLGQVLELRARSHTSAAIRALLNLSAKMARLIAADGSEFDIPLEQVRPGDRLRVRPGEKVPIDGVVLEGNSAIDESMITGESMPINKESGSQVIGATVNGNGALVIRAERVGDETMLAQIVQMVSQAQRTRAPIQRLADRVAGFFVPAVIGIAVLTFIAWVIFGPEPRFAHALVNAVAVLIIACPCALGLATPMSIMVGTGRGAHAGVLIKNAEALEMFEKVDTIVFDKTGTLTEGKPKVVGMSVPGRASTISDNEMLRLAASVERASEHPLGAAIVLRAKEMHLSLSEPSDVQSVPGQGVRGTVDSKTVAVGNLAFMPASAVFPERVAAGAAEPAGASVVFVAVDGKYAGTISVADPIRESSARALRELQAQGTHLVMLTGDNQATAKQIADMLKIEDFKAEVLPAQKAEIVKSLQKAGRVVAMAGDGINDAPALAQADVGIAMGTGTDIAIASSGITLLRGDLEGILRARKLSNSTMQNIRQNLFFAFLYNSIGVPIAAGILYPMFGLLLSPILAAAAMSFSSVSVITNSLRLRNARL